MALNRGQGASFTQMLRKVEEDLNRVRNEFLKEMAQEVVTPSPVDTGTYVMSHNVGERSARGQFTGNIRYIGPPGQNKEAMKAAALAKLYSQIESLPAEQTRVSLSNNSAHANIVEYGGWNWQTSPYKIYESARERAPSILSAVVARIKGGQ